MENGIMMKLVLALGTAAVALSASPSEARHYTHHMRCTRYGHGRCMTWRRMTRAQARRAGYRVGYRFGPTYGYTEYGALPGAITTQYHLRPTYRYVDSNGYVYVVNPNTYRVVRVIPIP